MNLATYKETENRILKKICWETTRNFDTTIFLLCVIQKS